jgi:lysophospholipase L1-like esterase
MLITWPRFFAVVLMIVVLVAGIIISWTNWTEIMVKKAISYPEGGAYHAQKELMSIYPSRMRKIVMLGDSHLGMVHWNEFLGRCDVLNRGIGGEVTTGALSRLDSIIALKPRLVVCQLGVNDIAGKGKSALQTWSDYSVLLNKLKAAKIPIVLNTVPPIRYQVQFNPEISELNGQIKKWAMTNGTPYIDLASLVSEDGVLRNDLTYDGLHLNAAGYLIWKTELVLQLPDEELAIPNGSAYKIE